MHHLFWFLIFHALFGSLVAHAQAEEVESEDALFAYEPPLLRLGPALVMRWPMNLYGGGVVAHLYVPHLLYGRATVSVGPIFGPDEVRADVFADVSVGVLVSWRGMTRVSQVIGGGYNYMDLALHRVPSREMLIAEAGVATGSLLFNDTSLPGDEYFGQIGHQRVFYPYVGMRYQVHGDAQIPPMDGRPTARVQKIESIFAQLMVAPLGVPQEETVTWDYDEPIIRRSWGVRAGVELHRYTFPMEIEIGWAPTPVFVWAGLTLRWDAIRSGAVPMKARPPRR
ncbi:MAG: hypothetical protein AAFV53_43070 [Myxococcota bacterium]